MSSHKIISSKKDLKEWLKYEKSKYGSNIIKNLFLLGEHAILRKHQIILRKTEYYTNTNKKLLYILYKIRLTKVQHSVAWERDLKLCILALFL